MFIALMRDLLYADDCDLIAHSAADMHHPMDCFSAACTEFGLTLSLRRTVVMYQPAPGRAYVPPSIFVYGKKLEAVEAYSPKVLPLMKR